MHERRSSCGEWVAGMGQDYARVVTSRELRPLHRLDRRGPHCHRSMPSVAPSSSIAERAYRNAGRSNATTEQQSPVVDQCHLFGYYYTTTWACAATTA